MSAERVLSCALKNFFNLLKFNSYKNIFGGTYLRNLECKIDSYPKEFFGRCSWGNNSTSRYQGEWQILGEGY